MRPISGIIYLLILILSVHPFYYVFGFSFGDGERYLSNIIIVVFTYAVFYFLRANILGRIDGFDVGLIIYLVAVFTVSLYASELRANPGIIVKYVFTPTMFYFVGKVFSLDENNFQDNYLRLRKYLLLLGPYYIILILLEYFGGINVFPGLLDRFASSVGASANVLYPILNYRIVFEAFHRVIGPLLEPTETALVMMIVFIVYLLWNAGGFWRKFRKFNLIMLFALIILSTSRASIIATLAVIGVWFVFSYRGIERALAICACLVLVLAGIFSFGAIKESMHEESYVLPIFGRLTTERTVEDRIEALEEGWELVKDNILFGFGVGTEVNIMDKIEPGSIGLTVHNFYLDNLLFKGVLISAGLLVCYLVLIRRSFLVFRNPGNEFIGNIALTHLLLTVGMLTFYFSTQEKLQIASLFWFYGGMVRGINRQGGVW